MVGAETMEARYDMIPMLRCLPYRSRRSTFSLRVSAGCSAPFHSTLACHSAPFHSIPFHARLSSGAIPLHSIPYRLTQLRLAVFLPRVSPAPDSPGFFHSFCVVCARFGARAPPENVSHHITSFSGSPHFSASPCSPHSSPAGLAAASAVSGYCPCQLCQSQRQCQRWSCLGPGLGLVSVSRLRSTQPLASGAVSGLRSSVRCGMIITTANAQSVPSGTGRWRRGVWRVAARRDGVAAPAGPDPEAS